MSRRNEDRWLEQFEVFKEYIAVNAKFPNATNVVYNGFSVGQWYRNQLSAYKGGFLPPERLALLDGFTPVWRGTFEERQAESRRLLLASDWKKNLSEKDVPIEAALSGDELYAALSRGLYSCQAYLEACEDHLHGNALLFFQKISKAHSKEDALFSLEHRETVFESQFPNLSFRHFHLFADLFGLQSSDLFKPEEIEALGHVPTFFESACAASAYSRFFTREDLIAGYADVINTLPAQEKVVLLAEYIERATRSETAKKLGVTTERVRQVLNRARFKLRHPVRGKQIRPEHPQDAQFRREKEARELARQQVLEQARLSEHDNHLLTPLESLNLSVRSFNCLRRAGVETLGDIAALSYDELSQIRNLGRKSADEIILVLDKHGLSLRPSPEFAEDEPSHTVIDNMPVSNAEKKTNTLYDMDLEDLDLSVRSFVCLHRAGIRTLGDLASQSRDDLKCIRNLGWKSYDEIVSKMHEYGLEFSDERDRAGNPAGEMHPSLDAQISAAKAQTPSAGERSRICKDGLEGR